MAEERLPMPHKLTLDERKNLCVTGVTAVVSFDDAAVILRTQAGTLAVQGSQLQLKTLLPEDGQVRVEGKITAMYYAEPRPAGWLQRLFR